MKKLFLFIVLTFGVIAYSQAQNDSYFHTEKYVNQIEVSAGTQLGASSSINHNGTTYYGDAYAVYKVWINGNEATVNFSYPSLFGSGAVKINGTTYYKTLNGHSGRIPFTYHNMNSCVMANGYVVVNFKLENGIITGSIELQDVYADEYP